ncbi:MAG TPA: hypothetical protein VHB48_03800 [Chitinophagaceae bacterium]|nr:hypothetical protein [Chitinophagaceae bacterium]
MTVKSFEQYFQSLILVCVSFMIASGIFFSVVLSITSNRHNAVASPQQIFILNIIAPVFAAAGLAVGWLVIKRGIAKAKQKPTLDEKLGMYKMYIIARYALMDAPSLFATLCCLLTGHKTLLAVTGAMLLMMVVTLPRKKQLMTQLAFSRQQIDFINSTGQ